MHRKDFIKLNLLAGLGLSFIPFRSSNQNTEKAFLTGKQNPYLNSTGIIHKTAYKSFIRMQKAALKDGIDIQIVSGFRSFDRQLKIWNKKYKQYQKQGLDNKVIIEKIISYSTIPGTSRHHWGTDIDIIDRSVKLPKNGLLDEEHYHGQGAFCQLNEWMQRHAHKFGFYLVYTCNFHRGGFKYEPWHYSYLPLSKSFLKTYLNLDHKDLFKGVDIEGKTFLDQNCLISYFDTHLKGINPVFL